MEWIIAAFALIVVGLAIRKLRAPKAADAKPAADVEATKAEAYFKAMFPELQPWYHPRNLVQFVGARQARQQPAGGQDWVRPPGLGVALVKLSPNKERERVRLIDDTGKLLSEFDYQAQDGGATLRLGRGKLTVELPTSGEARVRYWHPEREFKWTQKGGWRFTTRIADQSFESDDSGTRWSSDRSSSTTSSTSSGAVAVAGMVAAGGAFAGAGASGDWDAEAAESSGDNPGDNPGDIAAGTAY